MEMKKLTRNLSILEKLHLYVVTCKTKTFSSLASIVLLSEKVASFIMLTDGGSSESLDPSKSTGHNFKA